MLLSLVWSQLGIIRVRIGCIQGQSAVGDWDFLEEQEVEKELQDEDDGED